MNDKFEALAKAVTWWIAWAKAASQGLAVSELTIQVFKPWGPNTPVACSHQIGARLRISPVGVMSGFRHGSSAVPGRQVTRSPPHLGHGVGSSPGSIHLGHK